MSEQFQIAILGAGGTLILALLGGFATVAWYKFKELDRIKEHLADKAVQTENRLATLESEVRQTRQAVETYDKKAERWFVLVGSKAMHSPDDHLGIDHELERFVTLYIRHNGDMPYEKGSDWNYWKHFFTDVARNATANSTEKLLADGYVLLCDHKLSGASYLYSRKKVFPE